MIDEAAIQQLAQGDAAKGLLTNAANAAMGAAAGMATSEAGFANSFSIRSGVTGKGARAYVWVRVWNSSRIANLIEFGAPKRRAPRMRARVLGRAMDVAVGQLRG
ncbi:hypothetical protein [Microtetraspora malaysiensis]|uniref:hypothetical protein n=1 Tax=Microtetraspora malaysiensis TaxID=161358 RepID=UPI003D9280AC